MAYKVKSVSFITQDLAMVCFQVHDCQALYFKLPVSDLKRHDVREGDNLLLYAGPAIDRVLVEERDGTQVPVCYP